MTNAHVLARVQMTGPPPPPPSTALLPLPSSQPRRSREDRPSRTRSYGATGHGAERAIMREGEEGESACDVIQSCRVI